MRNRLGPKSPGSEEEDEEGELLDEETTTVVNLPDLRTKLKSRLGAK